MGKLMPKARDVYKGKRSFKSGECLVCGKTGLVNVCPSCNEVGCGYCLGSAGGRCTVCKSGYLKNITFELIRG